MQVNNLTNLRANKVRWDDRRFVHIFKVFISTLSHIFKVFQLFSSADDRCHSFCGIHFLALKNSRRSFSVSCFSWLRVPKFVFHLVQNLKLYITIIHSTKFWTRNILKCTLQELHDTLLQISIYQLLLCETIRRA